jgi:multiple sugar transport system ATP-binding protein
MATVTFKGAQRWYPGSEAPAVPGLDLEIGDGEFMVLVGPSGCGKSTTLRMLAGLEPVDEGGIFIDDRDVTAMPPKDRDIAMVFQNYALYPHMSVAENMGFALRMAKVTAAERKERVHEAARMLGLTDYLERRPRALSGGQRQRVAMGRAIVRKPAVFCMDEPLSNLDAKMRVQTRTDIATLQAQLGTTTVYVTHDQVEAMTMGHRVAVLHEGELQQVDRPLQLYDRPANLFVAGFIGSPRMNLLEAVVRDGRVLVGDLEVAVSPAAAARRSRVTIGVRPESFRLVPPGHGLAMEAVMVEELGADSFVHGLAEVDGARRQLIVRAGARGEVRRGDALHVVPDPAAVHVFDTDTGARLGH